MLEASDSDPWVEAYVAARSTALGTSDPWVVLWNRLKTWPQSAPPFAVLGSQATLTSFGSQLKSKAAELGARGAPAMLLATAELPALRSLRSEELLLAMARKAKIALLGWVREGDVVMVLGADPLAPIVYQLPAYYVESLAALGASPGVELGRMLELELGANQALAMLGGLQFREAAQIVERLDSLLQGVDPARATGLRARMISSRSGLFGMDSTGTEDSKKESDANKKPEPATDFTRKNLPEQGPYAAWLRALQAKTEDKEGWSRQRAIVARGVSPARLESIDFVYEHDAAPGSEQRCEIPQKPVPADLTRGDLLFANKLAQLAVKGVITPAQWARAYDALVTQVETTRTGWYAIASLLFQRGDLPGMSARGSAQYRRVTRLALDFLDALNRFQTAAPGSYQPSGQLLVAFSPGATSDPDLVSVLQRLMADNVKYKLAPAAESKKVMELVLMGSMSALSFPEPMRSAYLSSVSKELHDKLHGNLQQQTGWDVALLYALGALGEHLTKPPADLVFAGDQITRALENRPDIEARPIAVLTARGVQYGALGASGQLEPDKVSPRALGVGRKAARLRLRASLRDMAAPGERPNDASIEGVTTLLDGMIATSVLMATESKREPADSGKQCIAGPSKPSAKLVNNLRELAAVRDALARDRALWDSSAMWARRARMLIVILSDMLDIMAAPSGGDPRYQLPEALATRAVREGLAEWTSKDVAQGAAALHALVRGATKGKDAWKTLADKHGSEIASLLRAVSSLVGSESSLLSQVAVKAGIGLVQSASQPRTAEAKSGFIPYAQAFYQTGHPDHATIALLLSNAVAAASLESNAQAEALAVEHKSPAAWALITRRTVAQVKDGQPLDATQFERALRSITDDRCKAAQVDPVVTAGQAVARFAKGDKEGAARQLDDTLAKAESDGLIVPRVHYRLAEPISSSKRLVLDVHLTSAQGFISENSMSVGLEVFSDKKPPGLKVEVLTNQAEDAGRFFAHVASVASLYHLLQGHDARGAYDAVRALQAIEGGVRFGAQVVTPSSKKWATDSEETLLVLSELAVQRNQPLLAADLLLAVPGSDSAPVDAAGPILPNPAPSPYSSVALRSLPEIQEPMRRAELSHALVRKSRVCGAPKAPAAPQAESCVLLRRGIALWRAGAWSSPPKMRAGVKESCVDDETLIAILQQFEGKKPAAGWPQASIDRAGKWTARAVDSGYIRDALGVLRAIREAQVCSPALVAASRVAARRKDVTAADRVEWLTYALSCPNRTLDEATWEDMSKLADAGGRLTQPAATYKIDAAIVNFMVAQQDWKRLHDFVSLPAFLEHMNRVGPAGGAAALAIEHASSILAGHKPDLDGTSDRYQVACILFGDGGREGVCRELGVLRNRSAREPIGQLTELARRMAESMSGP